MSKGFRYRPNASAPEGSPRQRPAPSRPVEEAFPRQEAHTGHIPYPTPAHAVSLWLADDGSLRLAVPPTCGQRGHILTTPASADGIKWLLALLREREALREAPATIGQRGCPTQYHLEQVLRAMSPEGLEARIKKLTLREATLEDLEGELE